MSFIYYTQSKLVFGVGSQNQLEALLRENAATSILLIYSGDYVFDLGIHDVINQAARNIGANLIENGDVVPNPHIDLVRNLIDQARAADVDFILAVGGASSFDTAKAVGVGLEYDGDVWDLFTGVAEPQSSVSVGVISTIPGSGSEVSDCAVLQQGHDKRALENRIVIPKFAIVNPEYSRTAPYRYQAAAVADLAVGFLEPYFTAKDHLESEDRLLEGGLKAALVAGRRFVEDPQDLKNRTELHWLSATMFNHCFLATGSENDWTTHRIEHELGGEFDVIHGEEFRQFCHRSSAMWLDANRRGMPSSPFGYSMPIPTTMTRNSLPTTSPIESKSISRLLDLPRACMNWGLRRAPLNMWPID